MKAAYINPFLQAAVHVLDTMASVHPKPGKPFTREGKVSHGDISGIIGVTGDKQGSIVVSFKKDCALKVISVMMMQEYTELDSQVTDAVGEITNMISGDARRRLADLGMHFEAGIPTVICGPNHEITHISNGGPCIVIPFEVDDTKFFVEASFVES